MGHLRCFMTVNQMPGTRVSHRSLFSCAGLRLFAIVPCPALTSQAAEVASGTKVRLYGDLWPGHLL